MPSNIVVPEVGESIVDARVAKWLRKEGDAVSAGDPLVELETDKIDVEVSAPHAGVLSRIDRKDGDDVKVGEVLGILEESAKGAATPAGDPPATESEESAKGEAGRTPRATPTARKAAEANEVDLSQVRGSGDAGRVMRRDVESAAGSSEPAAKVATPAAEPPAAAAAKAKPAPPVAEDRRRHEGDRTEERVRMSKRRATIAKRLIEAQSTAAMLSTFNEVDMTAVMALRERHKQAFKERHGVNLGIASFFVKASIGALRAFPRVNAEIQGDDMVLKHYYDIGVAVGASEGLVVPVLRDADRLTFAEVEKGIREFAKRAEDGTLSLADLKGGTFTITNGGVFGSLLSTPILNPPQVGILGLHKIQDRPIAVNGQVVIRPMMYVALTYDHRIIDGSEAVTLPRARQGTGRGSGRAAARLNTSTRTLRESPMCALLVVANLLIALAVPAAPATAQIPPGKLRLDLLSSAVSAGQFVPVGDSGGAIMTTPIGGGYRLRISREGSRRRDCPSWYLTVHRDRSDEDWLRPRPPNHGSNWRDISAPNHEMHGDVRRFWLAEPPTEMTLQLHGVVTRGEGLGACFTAGYAEISWKPLPRLPREALEGIWREAHRREPASTRFPRGWLGDDDRPVLGCGRVDC